MKKFMVDTNDWTNFKEEYFTTAVKAATYIKKEKMNTFTIRIYERGHYHIVMTKNHEMITIYAGYAIPKVLTDLVRWKGGEKMNRKQGRKLLKPPKAEFEMLYYNKAVDVEQLAAYWSVSKQTIYNWAVEFRKEGSNEPRNRAPLRSNTTDSPESKQVQHEPQQETNL